MLPEHYDYAIEAAVGTFRELIGETFTEDSESMWRGALRVATDLMISGSEKMEAEVKESQEFELPAPTGDNYLARFLSAPEGDAHEPEPPIAPGTSLGSSFDVIYEGEKSVSAAPLQTILQTSLANGIPHFCECGGKAKCTTCRVMILDGHKNVLPRSQQEAVLAKEKGFSPDVRLGCQTRVTGPVKLKRLVFDAEDAEEVLEEGLLAAGREMNIAVMFADIRDYSSLSRSNLPYDVVHALNRYFRGVCEEIDKHNGYLDKFMGDGLMALFGMTSNGTQGCLDATRAAIAMQSAMEEINIYQREHLGVEISAGVGIHYGPVIIGEVGFRLKKQFTAIGEVVNIASRIEGMTRILTADILISTSVMKELPEGEFNLGPPTSVSLPGKETPLELCAVHH